MVPFANLLPVATEHIVQEANPASVFCHWTALSIHGLTKELPRTIFAYHFKNTKQERIPLGTTPEDWLDLERPRNALPQKVVGTSVDWTRSAGQRDFGHTMATFAGLPIYVTDLERTLLDAIRLPDKAGGIMNALRVWRSAKDRLSLDTLIQYVERFESGVLFQRAGFVLTIEARSPETFPMAIRPPARRFDEASPESPLRFDLFRTMESFNQRSRRRDRGVA